MITLKLSPDERISVILEAILTRVPLDLVSSERHALLLVSEEEIITG